MRILPWWRLSVYMVCAASGLVSAQSAAAHGVLVGATPAPNSTIETAPTRIELRFNEPVDARLSRVVLARGSSRIPLTLHSGGGRTVTYDVPALEPGAYVVDWRVISSVDGHFSRGSFAFGVGRDAVPAGAVDSAARAWPDVAVRWLGLVGALAGLGTAFGFRWLPLSREIEPGLSSRAARLATGAAVMVALSSLARLSLDALAIADPVGGYAAIGRAMLQVLGASPNGHDAVFRLTGAFFLAGMLRRPDGSSSAAVLAVGSVLLIGPTLTSHGVTAGVGGALLNLLHLAAAGIWTGGLVYFGIIYLPVARRDRPDLIRPAAVRFSRLALVCVVVLVVTGLAQARLYAGSPTDVAASTYGRTLIAKLILVLPLLCLAAVNRWRVVPRLAAATGPASAFEVMVRAEGALAHAVLLLAAAIAVTTPATAACPEPAQVDGATDRACGARLDASKETGLRARPERWP